MPSQSGCARTRRPSIATHLPSSFLLQLPPGTYSGTRKEPPVRALRGDYEAETEAVLPLIDHAGPPTPRSFALWARRRLLPLAGALFACALLFCVCSMLSLYSRTTDSGYAAAAYGGKRGLATSALRPPAAATAAPQPPLMTAEAHGEGAVGSSTRRDGRGERGGSRRRVVAETASTSSFLDPYSHLTLQQRQHIASGTSRGVDFDENGKRIRHKRGVEPTFVAFNHPPSRDANNSTAGRQHKGGGAPPPPPPLSASERLRLRYRSRKFLLPLLDQGPNNQYLQFRVAVAKARALNRTLVLPVWLPHNPKFLHLHPGAPPVPSRDRAIALLSFPFNSTFDAAHLAKFVRTIELPTFRTLTEGQLELCLALGSSHTDDAGFRDYLRLAGLSCSNFTSMDQPDERRERAAAARARYLGYHSYDREVGLRDRAFLPLRWSGPVLSVAERVAAELNLTHDDYVAAHIRVADAHWEHSDCHHSINGVPVPSVSCGDGTNVINYTSLAQEVWYALRSAEQRTLFVATNMNCSDWRLSRMALMLSRRAVRTVCAKEVLQEALTAEGHAPDGAAPAAEVQSNYFASLVEQELSLRAHTFIGSKYSTWTDTVRGLRLAAGKPAAAHHLFEELWALGVK